MLPSEDYNIASIDIDMQFCFILYFVQFHQIKFNIYFFQENNVVIVIDLISDSATPMAAARAEQTHAFNWIRSHLEESSETSLPKHEVFEDYR